MRSKASFRQAAMLDFVELLLPEISGEGKPNYNVVAIVCTRLLQCLPSSTLCHYDALADEWNRRHQDTLIHEGWGACPMVFSSYQGETVDHADMSEFVVYISTQKQLGEWTVLQKFVPECSVCPPSTSIGCAPMERRHLSATKTVEVVLENDQAVQDMKLLIKLCYSGSYIREGGELLDRSIRMRLAFLGDALEMQGCVWECLALLTDGLTHADALTT